MNDKDNIKLCIENIEKMTPNIVSPNDTMLVQALTPLLQACTREINKLLHEEIDLSSLSLCVRTIFELYLILMHISTDEKALNNWFGQSYKDHKDINDGFIALGKKRGLDEYVSELEKVQEFLDGSLDSSPFVSKGRFNIRDLAEKFEHLEDYKAVHKLCSKLIHPTSLNVNAYDALSKNNVYYNMIFRIGVFYSQQIEEFSSRYQGLVTSG
ncbi:MAG: hypothetical protein KAS85_05670 [Rhodobacteraceae bacterium]|nr:hypothetical protein [Paracoccaceae bacterium]